MSTNINISVGDNKLLAQASLQQNASRQAQLEKEANKRLEAQATDARTKELAAKGLDAQGNPLIGTPFQVPQVDRRPAASRQSTFDYGQGYFTVTRGVNNSAVVTVRSGDKNAVITEPLAGSEIPEGFRDRSGADSLPLLPNPPTGIIDALGNNTVGVIIDEPYRKRYVVVTDIVYNASVTNYESYTQTIYDIKHVSATPSGQITATTSPTGGWPVFATSFTSNLLVLPISSKLAIFAYVETRNSYKSYFLESLSYIQYRSTIGADCTPGPVQYSCTEQSTDRQTTSSTCAYLVGKSTVTKITYPSKLLTDVIASKRYTPDTFTDYIVEGTGQQFSCTTTPFVYTYRGRYFENTTTPPPANLNYTQSLMSYWGEVLQFPVSNRRSPGVYSALQPGITPVSTPTLYDDIQQLLPIEGQQFKWFRINEATDPDQLERYNGDLPEFYQDAFDETKFVQVRPVNYELQPGENYYRWNDWLKSSYCRQQALALGFTSADLTP